MIAATLAGLFGLVIYALLFFCLWKFYEMLSRINDNIAGIRQAMERNSQSGPANPPDAAGAD